MLSRKLLLGLAPLLAVIAFSVVPAIAQASPEWLVAGKAIPAGGKVAITSHGGPFVLKTVGGAEIKCTTLKDTGELFSGSPGTGLSFLTFTGCSSAVCPGTLTIESAFHVELILLSLFSITIKLLFPVPIFCNATKIGEVTETEEGAGFSGSISGKKFLFSKAGNLSFAGEEATITGEDEQEGTSGESITVS